MALVFATGCATGQFISQKKLQEKVGKIQVGFTTQKKSKISLANLLDRKL